jgi:hypothetical protein
MEKKTKIFLVISLVVLASIFSSLVVVYYLVLKSAPPAPFECIEGYWKKVDDGRIWYFYDGEIQLYKDGIKNNTGAYELFENNTVKITFGWLYEIFSINLSDSSLKLTVVSEYLDPWDEPEVYEYRRVSGPKS